MSNTSAISEKLNMVRQKVSPVYQKIKAAIGFICKWLYHLRKVFMAAPVVYLAVKLAMDNLERLPEIVGMNIQSTGEFAMTVTRNYAVFGPLGVTAFCLFLMFCSRKTLLPWMISVFSLVLPYLIYLTNVYAG